VTKFFIFPLIFSLFKTKGNYFSREKNKKINLLIYKRVVILYSFIF